MSNPLCFNPTPPTAWATVASLLHSETFLSAIREAREAREVAFPFGDGDCCNDDQSCVPCIDICPAVRGLWENLDEYSDRVEAMMRDQGEHKHQLDFHHARTQRLADENTNLRAEIKEAKRILDIRERQLKTLLTITPGPDADGAGGRFII